MKKVIVFLSHKINEEQKKELLEEFKIQDLIFLTDELQDIWSDVKCDDSYYIGIEKMKKFMIENLREGDYIIVQGNWGYVYELVKLAKEKGIHAIYSFSYRNSEEEILKDGISLKLSKYKHIKFIEY